MQEIQEIQKPKDLKKPKDSEKPKKPKNSRFNNSKDHEI